MIEGRITITDKEGRKLQDVNIWSIILFDIYIGTLNRDPDQIRIFVDGDEIPKPNEFEDDT